MEYERFKELFIKAVREDPEVQELLRVKTPG